jgi:hypothetical protein
VRSGWRTLVVILLAGCSADAASLDLEVTTGHETDALSRTPAVARLDIAALSGTERVAVASAAPGGAFDLGELDLGTLLSFEATGFGADGESLVRGQTLNGVVLGSTEPKVSLFVQRVDEWARPPAGLERTHVGGVAGVVGERYLVLTGGASALGASGDAPAQSTEFYDLLTHKAVTAAPFPRVARTLVSQPTRALLIGDDGATWVDFESQATSVAALPDGLVSFAELANGSTVLAPADTVFVVGAARAEAPSDAVLEVASDGSVRLHRLTAPRQGAAAAWVTGVGLVVAGGSDSAPGLEVLREGGAHFEARAFSADPTTGAALVLTGGGGTEVVLVGGLRNGETAGARVLDAACTTACAANIIDGLDLPALGRAQAYAIGAGRLLVVGNDAASGLVRSFTLDLGQSAAVELALREPRRGATLVAAPDATLVVMGGLHADGTPALTLERFLPESR